MQLGRESRLMKAWRPANDFDWTKQMLGLIQYNTSLLVWFKTKDASKDNPQHTPKFIYPPEVQAHIDEQARIEGFSEMGIKSEIQDLPLDELKALLARPRRQSAESKAKAEAKAFSGAKNKRSDAARKGWETRRASKAKVSLVKNEGVKHGK